MKDLLTTKEVSHWGTELRAEVIEYKHGKTILEGFLAYPSSKNETYPGVLVVHDMWGLDSYSRGVAEKLAKLGYAAFAVDMYGKGVRPRTEKEASSEAKVFMKDRQLSRARANAALEAFKRQGCVDTKQIAAIGYSLGGGVVLEMARGGADLAGVVSVYGNLDTPNRSDARNIKGKVLVLHGHDDPLVRLEQVVVFQEEMTNGNVDWQMVIYGGTDHGFTNPRYRRGKYAGVTFSQKAEKRSWEALKLFLEEIFK